MDVPMMAVEECPVIFDCEGDDLVGLVHRPTGPVRRGVLFVVAGGPQYRGGVARTQLTLARLLARQGVAVMRFDHRGVGDSTGRFRDFEDVEADLRQALAAFVRQVPTLQEVVLWGGCNAASAIMINAWKFPLVRGVILSNPWVHDPATADTAVVTQHFSRRLRDADFWRKVLRLRYDPRPAIGVLLRAAADVTTRRLRGAATDAADGDDPATPFVLRMRRGMDRFRGDVLLLMSGRSMVSKEFDALVAGSPVWQSALRRGHSLVRHDMPDADQTHSSVASREELVRVAGAWLSAPGRMWSAGDAARVAPAATTGAAEDWALRCPGASNA